MSKPNTNLKFSTHKKEEEKIMNFKRIRSKQWHNHIELDGPYAGSCHGNLIA